MTRFFDILFSALAILILSPFLVPVAIILLLTGEHYIFYRQTRVGKGGKDFEILKFATMLKDSPSLPGGMITLHEDPRVLPIGKFLRKTKINELPQLLNILMGDMSFVGPRPTVRKHYELFTESVRARIDLMTPGLTGIGSLVFRDEEHLLSRIPGDREYVHNQLISPYKGSLESWYWENRSLGKYFGLIFMTALSVFRPGTTIHLKFFKDLPEPPAELKAYVS